MNYKKGDIVHIKRETRDGHVIQRAEVIDTNEVPKALRIYYTWGHKPHHVREWMALCELVTADSQEVAA